MPKTLTDDEKYTLLEVLHNTYNFLIPNVTPEENKLMAEVWKAIDILNEL